MNTRNAQTIQKLLEQLTEANPAPVTEAEDRDPAPFKFSEALDKVGLRLESPAYIKKSCNDCFGRGFQTWLIGDGYRTGDHGWRVKRKNRDARACRCVVKGYVKTRFAHDRAAAL
jgi:hypothetical protein